MDGKMDKKETQRDWAENIIDNIIAIEEYCREAEKNKIGIDKKDIVSVKVYSDNIFESVEKYI